MAHRDVERHARPHRDAADDGACHAQVVEPGDEVVAEGVEAQGGRVAQRLRLPVGTGVETEQADALRRAKQARGLADVPTDPVLKDERHPLPDVEVMEDDAVALEAGHQRTSARAACGTAASAPRRNASVPSTSVSASPCT